MEQISIITGDHKSEIFVGESRRNIEKYLRGRNTVIITDDNIKEIYSPDFPDVPVITIKPGEESKTLSVVEHLSEKLLGYGIDRSGFVLAVGGGVVCDLAGFLASVYMRGIDFGFISTSLLSQVDASVGGKNGVNLGNVKNVIGNFRQPEFVVCDISMLLTLDDDEYLSGLAELIKMGAIMDRSLIETIEARKDSVLKRDESLMQSLVARSVKLKAAIVSEDERESGIRMILNFGHTFGHVIETIGVQKHGFAVASGMVIAAAISNREGLLSVNDLTQLTGILQNFCLLRKFDISPEKFREMIASDKKKKGSDMSFVMIESPGKAVIRKMSINKLAEYYSGMREIL